MRGNEAIAQGAIDAGCRYFFGYPITPQNEIPTYMARHLPEVGGCFVQAESELAAINMVYGASAAGVRVMTASSSPGISLKQEGISYLAACELPAVIVNVVRGGPGLGNIAPAQSDYFQSVKGGGHGDYHLIVLAPWSVQELYDLTREAFDLADEYRRPALILADAILGQMMEPMTPARAPVDPAALPPKPWATNGTRGRRERNIINSLWIEPEMMERLNLRLHARDERIRATEVRWEGHGLEDADLVLVAYGTSARICRTAVDIARQQGKRVGLFRPISLWPYPCEPLRTLRERVRQFLVVEMSLGQMVEDVRLAVEGRRPVHFYGRTGGVVPTPQEIAQAMEAVWE